MIETAGIQPEDEVLEVGAGPGTLTADLVRLARRVVAVEVDQRLLSRLRAAAPEAEVLSADILELDLGTLFPEGGEVVVGNIPYYLSGALLRRLLEPEPRPKRLSLVVQREVAQRWCGEDGWSLSTVVVHAFSRPRLAFTLPPAAFRPPPKVHSALVVLEVLPRPALQVPDPARFFRFAASLFQFRRKQLQGSLARLSGLPAADVAARLRSLCIEPSRRPETLRLAEWEVLHEAFGSPMCSQPVITASSHRLR
ncbi:MAG: 16S rRNA (adenine(1518)-N(6)/adenine(1519)-N(6))-dimethyltransferase RsmA [Candidatus Dormibacteraeota bacterium]|uniref:16S rRNA (Adenine(1518)-N(6)/adenine(1519)-N(6))-dimethyltransferase RsmA n=1 Tax=Candidatus Dormiibacter inghamiae TaxID=3127013 RepID=A0A934KDN3_9BACT|nr:16S rRNA (adenine(1518)-N(6)/adenine(1519)-N(6))-dimethyltransferase RsmA [Candidatus Dormibacteraeota bacterium]MBJ7607464.1 16S rRNA (adenine(1518)-N(6)/adenine(1519)-N(6))-dimethyltransferase RsmA [Candidatus Dormibacteraeota bacterium]